MSGKMTPIGRVSYPAVWEPTAMEEGKEKLYQMTLVFPDEGVLKPMKKEALEIAKEKWPKALPKGLVWAWRSAPDYTDKEGEIRKGYEKGEFIRFKSKTKPGIVDAQKKTVDEESGRFFAGVWARCTYSCFATTKGGTPRVLFWMNNIQLVRSDEPFGAGKVDPRADFADDLSEEDVAESVEETDEEFEEMFG